MSTEPRPENPRRCERCKAEHTIEISATACAHRHATRDALLDVATRTEKPPTPAQVEDLWAHLNGIYDTDASRRAVMYVLDLGWRPAIGATS